MPIIPMLLVNGCQGIGTGWSTFIPNFNPRELCEIIKGKLKGKEFPTIHPWYKNFTG
jgi:DNA topoisomerase-2